MYTHNVRALQQPIMYMYVYYTLTNVHSSTLYMEVQHLQPIQNLGETTPTPAMANLTQQMAGHLVASLENYM